MLAPGRSAQPTHARSTVQRPHARRSRTRPRPIVSAQRHRGPRPARCHHQPARRVRATLSSPPPALTPALNWYRRFISHQRVPASRPQVPEAWLHRAHRRVRRPQNPALVASRRFIHPQRVPPQRRRHDGSCCPIARRTFPTRSPSLYNFRGPVPSGRNQSQTCHVPHPPYRVDHTGRCAKTSQGSRKAFKRSPRKYCQPAWQLSRVKAGSSWGNVCPPRWVRRRRVPSRVSASSQTTTDAPGTPS